VEDPKSSITQRYKRLCSTMIRLAADVSTSPTLYELADNVIHDLCKQAMEVRLQPNAMVNDQGGVPTMTEPIETTTKGYKNRRGLKRQKRLKSWVELQSKRAPIVQPSSCLQLRVYKFICCNNFSVKKILFVMNIVSGCPFSNWVIEPYCACSPSHCISL